MTEKLGKRYTKEIKDTIVKRMMLPTSNEAIIRISEVTGITEATLVKWRKDDRVSGNASPGDEEAPNNGKAKKNF